MSKIVDGRIESAQSADADCDCSLDSLHHVAIAVDDIAAAVSWYRSTFKCSVKYEDETWALLGFKNSDLALVIPEQHPPHIAFSSSEAESYGELKTHRDGTRSTYVSDCSGNSVEVMAEDRD
ncbi:MAG: VOC family protein [Fuerstiella sp.]|nr:VOC family protein [Fuerstiella sp.]